MFYYLKQYTYQNLSLVNPLTANREVTQQNEKR